MRVKAARVAGNGGDATSRAAAVKRSKSSFRRGGVVSRLEKTSAEGVSVRVVVMVVVVVVGKNVMAESTKVVVAVAAG